MEERYCVLRAEGWLYFPFLECDNGLMVNIGWLSSWLVSHYITGSMNFTFLQSHSMVGLVD